MGEKNIEIKKLNALTTLRFFAAVLIVINHSQSSFGIPYFIYKHFFFAQAVSFFFLLSGFILTYVYSSLGGKDSISRYFFARIGRIWPIHLTTLVLM